jgi:hypothetical protein
LAARHTPTRPASAGRARSGAGHAWSAAR